MWIEEKQDDNSYHRGRQGAKDAGKIRGRSKYILDNGELIHMGTLEMTLHCSPGLLTVDLHRANNIAGKRSQDSYAQVFLIEERPAPFTKSWDINQKVFFQAGHEQTEIFKKNINPEFNDTFKFKMDAMSISNKSLVVSIWDKDSSSRDDFMAGVTIPLRNVARFQKLSTRVSVDLQYQEMDGYPVRLTETQLIKWFGPLVTISSGWDLKECNNRLVTYIDRARVLRQAYEVKEGLPSHLQDRISVVQAQSTHFLGEQMDKLRNMLAETRRRRSLVEQRRKSAKDESERQERRYHTQVTILRERQATLDSLAQDEAKLRCRECSGSSLRDYFRDAVRVPQRVSYKPAAIQAEALALEKLELKAVNLGANMHDEKMEQIIIKIRNEFHEKLMAKLNEARKKYKTQSKLEISIEEDIMKIYQALIRQRADINGVKYSLEGLRMLERNRDYRPRIQQLLSDIQLLKSRIEAARNNGQAQRAEWDREMMSVNAALDAALARLRDLMSQMSGFMVSEETSLDELSVYQQLLNWETGRLNVAHLPRRAAVTERTSARRSTSASASMRNSYSSSSTMIPGNSYKKRDSSADSGRGYSKAATPDGTLEHRSISSFEFSEEHIGGRTSGRSSRNSGFLQGLEGQMN